MTSLAAENRVVCAPESPDEDLSHLLDESAVSACLIPFLRALEWRGELRHVAEALPHFDKVEDAHRLRGVLANLHVATREAKTRLADIDPRLLPCLFLPRRGSLMVLLERDGDRFTVFDGAAAEIREIEAADTDGLAYFARYDAEAAERIRTAARSGRWCQVVGERFRSLVLQLLGISFVSNLMALAVPIFIMSVYDTVIGSGDPNTLYYLFGGIILALFADAGLRMVRTRILAYVAGRIDLIVGTATFQQILHLPLVATEKATIGSQIARLRQFESLREFFSGPLAGAFLDLPFILIFLIVIAAIAGPLVWIPIVLVGVFAIAASIFLPALRRVTAQASRARAEKEGFLIETLSRMRAIKASSVEAVWSRRFRDISADAALSSFRAAQLSTWLRTLAQLLMLLGGIATLGVGTLMVLDEAMTMGALVASMALVWRILSPLQLAFLSFTRLEQVGQSLKQINTLMRQPVEREPGAIVEHLRSFQGHIRFERVSLRYNPRSEPALLAVNAEIKPGEVVAITGPNGSGKSTLLKLIAGLYEPQFGGIFIDGMDTRQLDIDELRAAIGYVPQTCDLFYGTIAQNLRLANPTASERDLAQAALDAGLLEEILAFSEGFETRLTDQLQRQLPGGVKQRLMLARAYVKSAPILLMDEPGNGLDREGDEQLMRKLQSLRGRSTVLLVTHRPSHMRLADKVFYLEGGRLMLAGSPERVLPQMGIG